MREVTFSSGFGYDSVRDAEGSRAADAGAPPRHGATWIARMRSAVSAIRCQTKASAPIMAARPHSAAEFGRIREQVLFVVLQRTVLGSSAASGLIQITALPQVSLQTGAQSAGLRHAVGSGGAPRFRSHGPFGCLANAPFAKWSLRRSQAFRVWSMAARGAI